MQQATKLQEDHVVRFAREVLCSAVLSDTLDTMGLIHQIMDTNMRPLDESQLVVGRARTGSFRDVYGEVHNQDVYKGLADLVSESQPGDVLVLACGRSGRIQVWGDVAATAAQVRGTAGCITDGLIRDVSRIRAMGYPCFAAGYGAIGTPGRGVMGAMNTPVHCAGVWVAPGDLIFGDVDGIVVVPQRVEAEVIRHAAAIAERERDMLNELRAGRMLADVYHKYGTL